MLKVDRTVTVIGSASVGKSALTIRLVQKKFTPDYDPTIARTYHHNMKANGYEYSLTVLDTAGLERQTQIPHNYLSSHGYILVYSITDLQSFENVKEIYNLLVDEFNGGGFAIVLAGNKSDLNDQRRITYEAGNKLAAEWRKNGSKATFIETSALSGDKVEDVFISLLSSLDQPVNKPHQAKQPPQNHVPNREQRRAEANADSKCIIS